MSRTSNSDFELFDGTMKIYFAASIRGEKSDPLVCRQLVAYLGKFGQVYTDPSIVGKIEKPLSDRDMHLRDMNWLSSSDAIVAEVSARSLGVGYEIGRAIEKGKPMLCLYKQHEGNELSAMINGCLQIILGNYQMIEEAYLAIDKFFSRLRRNDT